MRITTWNVNGLRSAVRGDFEHWLCQSGDDVVCLQEVKAEADLLTTHWFDGYRGYWYPAARPGCSGVATLVRDGIEPRSVTRGIGHASDLEGRVLTTSFDELTVVNVYAPHSHRTLSRLPEKVSFLAALTRYVSQLRSDGHRLVLVGDFNVAHQDIDLRNAKANRKNAGFLPEERQWVTELLSSGFVDTFRQFEDGPGHYTWWSMRDGVKARNVGWRLDYAFVEGALTERLQASRLQPERPGSDHCPVTVHFTPVARAAHPKPTIRYAGPGGFLERAS